MKSVSWATNLNLPRAI